MSISHKCLKLVIHSFRRGQAVLSDPAYCTLYCYVHYPVRGSSGSLLRVWLIPVLGFVSCLGSVSADWVLGPWRIWSLLPMGLGSGCVVFLLGSFCEKGHTACFVEVG
ncbi:hypothetical protein GGS24DRAFT_346522 [Hypoxylon argillaceum]|nr:hypothetical protein GGS24DRAFT_346522 [Hypoxylon argillaceum]